MSKQLDMDQPLDSDVEIEYFYDSHPTPEDLMGETAIHAELIEYLKGVLRWHFREQVCALYGNLNFYQTGYYRESPLAPDIAVIKGLPYRRVKSWKVGRTGPPPHVVFEIASPETWDKDLTEKPDLYAQMGVQEYFAYDPNDPQCWKDKPSRLLGWRLDSISGTMHKIVPDEQERLWSIELESWLVPDEQYLRLYDRHSNLRLTGEEAAIRRAEVEAMKAQLEAKRADMEARRAQREAEARQAEARRADAESSRAEALAEKLRSLGVDPDKIT